MDNLPQDIKKAEVGRQIYYHLSPENNMKRGMKASLNEKKAKILNK